MAFKNKRLYKYTVYDCYTGTTLIFAYGTYMRHLKCTNTHAHLRGLCLLGWYVLQVNVMH